MLKLFLAIFSISILLQSTQPADTTAQAVQHPSATAALCPADTNNAAVQPEVRLPAGSPSVDSASRPVIAVSTNIPYDITYIPHYGLTSIPSFSLEYYPKKGHYTFGGDVEWPMWKHPAQHRYMQINNITLWSRRYFKEAPLQYEGWYLLASANAARFGIGYDAKGWQGEGVGISVGGGYKHYFRDSRIFFDAGLALGGFYARYDPYVWGNDATGWYYYDYAGEPKDFVRRRMAFYWLGPTRVYFSVGIDLFNRKKK